MSLLNRRDALLALLCEREKVIVVAGLGSSAYDLASCGNEPLDFPLWGAMGGAVMVGLGLALAQPEYKVLVLTGDGEMLMGLGSLAMSYADTQDAGVRRRSQEQFIAQLTVYALSAIGKGYLHLLNLEALREWHRAEYADRYQKLGFPKKDRLGFDEEATRDAVLAGVRRLLGSSERGPLFFRLSPGDDSAVEPWRYDEKTQRLLLPHDCKLGFFTPDGAHRYEVDSIIMVQSDPGPIDPARRPDWRIAGLELIDARDLSLAGPGGRPRRRRMPPRRTRGR